MGYEPTSNSSEVYRVTRSLSEKRGLASPSGLVPSCRAPEPRLRCSTGTVRTPQGHTAKEGDAGLASWGQEMGVSVCVSHPICG